MADVWPALDVLVVDDDPAVRTSFGDVLRQAGYRVKEAEDGFAAFALIKSRPAFGAVVLDLALPVLDGLHLLEMIDDPPPVILMSGQGWTWNDPAILERRDKFLVFVEKPVSPAVLLAVVELALDGRRPAARR